MVPWYRCLGLRFLSSGTNVLFFPESIREQDEGDKERGTDTAEGVEETGPRSRDCGPLGGSLVRGSFPGFHVPPFGSEYPLTWDRRSWGFQKLPASISHFLFRNTFLVYFLVKVCVIHVTGTREWGDQRPGCQSKEWGWLRLLYSLGMYHCSYQVHNSSKCST